MFNYIFVVFYCLLAVPQPLSRDIVQIKVTCFIHLGKFDEGLLIATQYDYLSFERAYILYRLNRVSHNQIKEIKSNDLIDSYNDT